MANPVSICVIGSGYVGLVAAACFADIGHRVICVDNDEARIRLLSEGGVPIFEEHLPEMLARHRDKVTFTTHLGQAVEQSEAVFIAVGTPQGDSEGAADLSYVEAVVAEIARTVNGYKVIVEKSTVPVYTNDWIRRILHRHGVDAQRFDVVSNPEFLREGTAVQDFLHPDRIVVGSGNERAAEVLRRIYEPLTDGQLLRHAGRFAGSLQRRASRQAAGHVGAECGDHQARVERIFGPEDIVHQCGCQPGRGRGRGHRGHRHGYRPRQPHRSQVPARGARVRRLLFSQGCGRIPLGGAATGRRLQLLEEVRKINDTQREVFFNKVLSALWTLRGKRLAALGLAFKGDTDDIRESPAIAIIKKLLHAGATSRPTIPRPWNAPRK